MKTAIRDQDKFRQIEDCVLSAPFQSPILASQKLPTIQWPVHIDKFSPTHVRFCLNFYFFHFCEIECRNWIILTPFIVSKSIMQYV